MPVTKKNTNSSKKRPAVKRKLAEVTVVTKTAVSINEISVPKKFNKMNEMLSKTTFLPSK